MIWIPVALAASAIAVQPSGDDVQRAFEAGMHEQVVEAARSSDDPQGLCLAGLSLTSLESNGQACSHAVRCG